MLLFTEARRNTASSIQPILTHIQESEHDYYIQIEAPGFTAKDIAIKATPHALTINGMLKSTQLEGYKTLSSSRAIKHRIEKRYRFRSRLDSNKVSANLTNGLLEIRAPKVQVEVKEVPIHSVSIDSDNGCVDETEDDDVI